MNRRKLKRGGKCRTKAIFGTDIVAAGINAAATTAAALMQVKATKDAAKQQEKAILDTGKQNADAIKQQTENNTKLEETYIASSTQMNKENQDFMKDAILSAQIQGANENLEYKLQAGRQQAKAGGSSKRFSLKSQLPYGGGRLPFTVTDGGGVLPIQIDNNGYGLFEIIGNDHEHYHKAPGGKNKTGVGIKFRNGGIIEGEGNQNTNQGELLYVTPEDALFISKHSLKGFNPAKAVDNGMHPKQAFAYQEAIKDRFGINDDGTKAKCGKRKSIKKCGGRHKANYGTNPSQWGVASLSHTILDAPNTQAIVNVPRIISTQNIPTQTTIGSNTRSSSFGNFLGNYSGALINTAGNLIGAGLSWIGNRYAANKIAKAQEESRQYALDAISQMHGIDLSQIKRENFQTPHTLAIVRSADVNVNPQLRDIDRKISAQKRDINRNTLSSAAKLTRFAESDDRGFQRKNEVYANEHNLEEAIKRENAQSITQNQQANADRDVQANRDFYSNYLQGAIFNAGVDNDKLRLSAEVNADANNAIASALGGATQAGLQGFANAFSNSGQAFATRFDYLDKAKTDFRNNWYGLGDIQQVDSALASGDRNLIDILVNRYTGKNDEASIANLNRINSYLKRKSLRS